MTQQRRRSHRAYTGTFDGKRVLPGQPIESRLVDLAYSLLEFDPELNFAVRNDLTEAERIECGLEDYRPIRLDPPLDDVRLDLQDVISDLYYDSGRKLTAKQIFNDVTFEDALNAENLRRRKFNLAPGGKPVPALYPTYKQVFQALPARRR